MKEEKSILLIAFKFPPFAGVGGFRWSKMSKYLAQKGYKVHVVTVEWENIGVDKYSKDTDNPNIIIHRIRSFYPHNFKYKRFKNNLFGKLLHFKRHAILKLLDIFWYEDEAQYWGSYLIPYCEELIQKEKIKNVISTGAPFMANFWAAKLKVRNPDINLILDFRDPWTDNKNIETKMKLFKKKSIKKEKLTLNNCDIVVSVTPDLLNIFMEKIAEKDIRGVYLPNGYDINIKELEPVKNRNFSFLHAGGLIVGRQEPLKSFLKAVNEIKNEVPEIKIDFYGNVPNAVKRKYFKLFEKKIAVQHTKVHPDEIKKKMMQSFVCLHFNARFFPMSASTKIYEHAFLKRPTFSVNYGGEIERLINKYNLGISVNGDDIEKIKDELLKLYEIWKKNPQYQISPNNIEFFDYRNIVGELEKYFK